MCSAMSSNKRKHNTITLHYRTLMIHALGSIICSTYTPSSAYRWSVPVCHFR